MSGVEKVNPHRMAPGYKVSEFADLCLFLGGSTDSWTGLLLRLIGKSDPEHKAALAAAFPIHVRAHTAWMQSAGVTVEELEVIVR